jgi:hypothetical protein
MGRLFSPGAASWPPAREPHGGEPATSKTARRDSNNQNGEAGQQQPFVSQFNQRSARFIVFSQTLLALAALD